MLDAIAAMMLIWAFAKIDATPEDKTDNVVLYQLEAVDIQWPEEIMEQEKS